jgi:hypothetical protein
LSTLYGDSERPAFLGSGGGSDSGPAGSGGGAIKILAGAIRAEGGIWANGQDGSRYGGGGAGGSILLGARQLSGGGSIRARGGAAGIDAGGGGGGRIAVYFTESASMGVNLLEVSGGAGYADGAAGSAVLRQVASLVFLETEPAGAGIRSIRILSSNSGAPFREQSVRGGEVLIEWEDPNGAGLETSTDLRHWQPLVIEAFEAGPVLFRGSARMEAPLQFFRVRPN